MVHSPINNKTPHLNHNIYTNQQKQKTPAPKTREVWQDKGVLTNARAQADQPAPLAKESRADPLNTNTLRAQKTNPSRVKLVHTTLWLHPLVRAELDRRAREESLSVSSVGGSLLEWAIRQDIQRQQASVLEPKIRQLIREENRALGNRLVFFLMRIAFSAEQARLLITNTLKLVIKLTGGDQKSYYTIVDESAKLAKRNILARTPQFKSLLEEYEQGEAKVKKEVNTN